MERKITTATLLLLAAMLLLFGGTGGSAWGQDSIAGRIDKLLREMREDGRAAKDVVDDMVAAVEESVQRQFHRPNARNTHPDGSELDESERDGLGLGDSNPNDAYAVSLNVSRCVTAFRATHQLAETGVAPPQSVFTMNVIDDGPKRMSEIKDLTAPTPLQEAERWGLVKRWNCVYYDVFANGGIYMVRMDPCRYCDGPYIPDATDDRRRDT